MATTAVIFYSIYSCYAAAAADPDLAPPTNTSRARAFESNSNQTIYDKIVFENLFESMPFMAFGFVYDFLLLNVVLISFASNLNPFVLLVGGV